MNITKRAVLRVGFIGFSALAVVLTGCQTHVVHENTRTVYMPAPAPQPPPPVVYEPPSLPPLPEQPPVVVIQSENDFYEPLAAHGRWVVVGSYGRCWVPAHVESDWRPYSNGYWQRTDAGWYWVSDEPWGWATYHYGRWDYQPQYGWFWVPQTQWAPAWVAWREGGGYVGWAPLRPSVRVGASVSAVEYEPAFASRAFVFVEHRRMLEPVRPRTVIVNNTTIINKTVNITNVKVVNKTVINEGPRPDVIERESGRKVKAVAAHEFRRNEEATVAAREPNIRTSFQRDAQLPSRTERQPAERNTAALRAATQVERPAVMTQPQHPSATPARPAVRPIETAGPTREQRRLESETTMNITTPPTPVVSEPRPEAKPEQVLQPRREVRSHEKPEVTARPTLQPGVTLPVPSEKKHETVVEKKDTATPKVIEAKPKQDERPEVRRGESLPKKADAVHQPAVRNHSGQPSESPVDRRLMSPNTKSHAAEQAEMNKKEERGPQKKGKDHGSSSTNFSIRPSQ